jgi:hypothetical protein
MHSIADCIGGALIGSVVATLHFLCMDLFEEWIATASNGRFLVHTCVFYSC